MANQRRRPVKVSSDKDSNVVVQGITRRENLPYSWVHYPKHYGVFLGFSKSKDDFPALCDCTKGSISNFTKMYKNSIKDKNTNPYFKANMVNCIFPKAYSNKSFLINKEMIRNIEFIPKACHRCNMATPSMSWCHSMYGGQFKQTFGWYIHQVKLRLGVLYSDYFTYLNKECPDEIIQLIRDYKSSHKREEKERSYLMTLVNAPLRKDIDSNQVTYWHNVKIEEAKPYNKIKKKVGQQKRQLDNYFENITREEFGFRKIGDSYISESLLFKIIARLFPQDQIIRHHRPGWLDGLELDVFLPNKNLAIEYQGQQHYYPVKAWGGVKALNELQERDKRKRAICEKKGVMLISVDYTEPLTEDHLKERLKSGTYGLANS